VPTQWTPSEGWKRAEARLLGEAILGADGRPDVEAMARHHGLGDGTADELRRRSRPSMRLVPDERGSSRLGGCPDLPGDVEWPGGVKGPLAFFAQVDLTAAAGLVPDSPLPEKGVLQFFWDEDYGPPSPGATRVISHDDVRALRRRSPPRDAVYPELAARVVPWLSVDPAFARDVSMADDQERWLSLSNILGLANRGHRLLGYASPLQDAVEEEAARRAGDRFSFVLELDGDHEPFGDGAAFADGAHVYFLVPADGSGFEGAIAIQQGS
jgi:hypothetical protein